MICQKCKTETPNPVWKTYCIRCATVIVNEEYLHTEKYRNAKTEWHILKHKAAQRNMDSYSTFNDFIDEIDKDTPLSRLLLDPKRKRGIYGSNR